jgi:hypothetical protein
LAGLHIQCLRDDHCGDNAVYSDIAVGCCVQDRLCGVRRS